jgi:hypothetical protein
LVETLQRSHSARARIARLHHELLHRVSDAVLARIEFKLAQQECSRELHL